MTLTAPNRTTRSLRRLTPAEGPRQAADLARTDAMGN